MTETDKSENKESDFLLTVPKKIFGLKTFFKKSGY